MKNELKKLIVEIDTAQNIPFDRYFLFNFEINTISEQDIINNQSKIGLYISRKRIIVKAIINKAIANNITYGCFILFKRTP